MGWGVESQIFEKPVMLEKVWFSSMLSKRVPGEEL